MIKNINILFLYIFFILLLFCIMYIFIYSNNDIKFDNIDNINNKDNKDNKDNKLIQHKIIKDKFDNAEDIKNRLLYTNILNNMIDNVEDTNRNFMTTINTIKKNINTKQIDYNNEILEKLTNIYFKRYLEHVNNINAVVYNKALLIN